jgi:hypothetical protein
MRCVIVRPFVIVLLAATIVAAARATAYAGPPYLTDDPEPVP